MKLNIKQLQFIPNGKYKEISKLIAKDNEEKVEILHSYSNYETRKQWISQEKTEEFKYPCVYNVNKDDLNIIWSNNTYGGHFKYKKVIFNCSANGGTSTYVDKDGEYGICQFCAGIVDKEENLENIKKAIDSDKFLELMKFCKTGTALLNRKIIAQFRKDFYKDFL